MKVDRAINELRDSRDLLRKSETEAKEISTKITYNIATIVLGTVIRALKILAEDNKDDTE